MWLLKKGWSGRIENSRIMLSSLPVDYQKCFFKFIFQLSLAFSILAFLQNKKSWPLFTSSFTALLGLWNIYLRTFFLFCLFVFLLSFSLSSLSETHLWNWKAEVLSVQFFIASNFRWTCNHDAVCLRDWNDDWVKKSQMLHHHIWTVEKCSGS